MANPRKRMKKKKKISKRIIIILVTLGIITGTSTFVTQYINAMSDQNISEEFDNFLSSSQKDANGYVEEFGELMSSIPRRISDGAKSYAEEISSSFKRYADNKKNELGFTSENQTDNIDDNEKYKQEDEFEDEIINECVDNTVMNLNDLYSELDLDSPIEILTVYCELLNNGTLSNNNSFKYTDNYQEDLNCDYNLSYSVLKGTGVCRNVDDLFRKSLNSYGYTAYSCTCYNSNIVPSNNTTVKANHQLTIVNDYDQVYLLDPTQNTICDNYDYDKIYTNGKHYNYLMPECSLEESGYICSYNSEEQINEINYMIENDEDNISKDYVDEEINEALNKLNSTNGRKAVKNFKTNMKENVFNKIK